MGSIDRSGKAPKYGVLADTFRQRIRRGVWPPGSCLPSLNELADEFRVARLTARQAVQLLVKDGWLQARQGAGTFVMNVIPAVKNIKVETSLQALSDMYVATPPEIRTISETVGHLPPGWQRDETQYVCLKRVHSENGIPYCVIDVYIDQDLFKKAAKRFRERAAIPVLMSLKGCRVVRAYQTLTVGTADEEVATLIDVPVNAPVAFVERAFEDANHHIVYFAVVVYRGEAVRLDISLTV